MHSQSISVVKASWHAPIVGAFVRSCREHLDAAERPLALSEYEVPGVVEIPLFCQKLIEHANPDLIIVVGLVADHGVYRHDFVAASVMDSVMALQMQTGTPIIYGILTPQEFMSEGREAFFLNHFVVKGREAASACLKTLDNVDLLSGPLGQTG